MEIKPGMKIEIMSTDMFQARVGRRPSYEVGDLGTVLQTCGAIWLDRYCLVCGLGDYVYPNDCKILTDEHCKPTKGHCLCDDGGVCSYHYRLSENGFAKIHSDTSEEVSTMPKFKVGDRVMDGLYLDRVGTVQQIVLESAFPLKICWDDGTKDSYSFNSIRLRLIQYTPDALPKEVSPIKTVKSLFMRLLGSDDALIAENVFLEGSGHMDMNNPLVQESLLLTPGFKENLIKLIKADVAEKEKKK